MSDEREIIDEALRISEAQFGMKYPAAEAALERLESQNQALQEALAFYAEPRNHEWQQIEHENGERYTKASSLVDEDAGARARDALSQETEAE